MLLESPFKGMSLAVTVARNELCQFPGDTALTNDAHKPASVARTVTCKSRIDIARQACVVARRCLAAMSEWGFEVNCVDEKGGCWTTLSPKRCGP